MTLGITTVLSRDGKEKGKPTGGSRPCQLEGCCGTRVAVRWKDGKITYPCSKGFKYISNSKVQIV